MLEQFLQTNQTKQKKNRFMYIDSLSSTDLPWELMNRVYLQIQYRHNLVVNVQDLLLNLR